MAVGNKIKKILSITGATIAVSGVGLGIVIDHLRNNSAFQTHLNSSASNILKSGDNQYNLSAALITKEITDTHYKFKLATAGTNGMVVSNRFFYEIAGNKTSIHKPVWEAETNSYVYIVNRTEQEKVVSFSYNVQLPNTSIVTIVANDFVVRPTFNNYKITLSKNENNISNAIEMIDVDLSNDNYKYYDSLQMVWERKYDIPGTKFNKFESSLFDSEKIFSKEFCGKFVKVSATENILAPVGLYKNGLYQFANFEVSTIESNIINISPGMLSEYKLEFEFNDYHVVNLKSKFISSNSQKENDYQILFWEVRENFENWKQININTTNLVQKYNPNKIVEYRFAYNLKNGNDFDVSYSNSIIFDKIDDLSISKKNNTLFVALPDFINKYDVNYQWFISEKDDEFKKINNNSYELMINEDVNAKYKVIIDSPNFFKELELPVFEINNNVITSRVNIEFSNSFVDAISVKASIDDQENVHYVWGNSEGILKDKSGSLITLIRQQESKDYWVFGVVGNKKTTKTNFTITEAFNPYLSLTKEKSIISANIGNKNIDVNKLNYVWYQSYDNRRFDVIENESSNYINTLKYPKAKYIKLKLMYVEENDIMMSMSMAI